MVYVSTFFLAVGMPAAAIFYKSQFLSNLGYIKTLIASGG
jgi:hypothetical protein